MGKNYYFYNFFLLSYLQILKAISKYLIYLQIALCFSANIFKIKNKNTSNIRILSSTCNFKV